LKCITEDPDPIEQEVTGKASVKDNYFKMRDFSTSQGLCEEYNLREKRVLPNNSMPGEVHRHLKSIGIVKRDILYRFENINQNWISFQDWEYETKVNLTDSNYRIHLTKVGTYA
jgi:hypothetical protein